MTDLKLAFDVLSRGTDKAAAGFDKVGNSAEKVGHKADGSRKQLRLLGSTFASASAGALGPLQEVVDKLDLIGQASENAHSKLGGKLLGAGIAGVGIGSLLQSLGSREQGAQQQLQASVEATGHSFAEYADEVEKAIKQGEHFGDAAPTTLDALNRLTLTTHSPEEALKALGKAFDVAAAKHVPLATAAEKVGLIFNGSAKAGKQFGLQLEDTTGAAKALTVAQNASTTANDKVTRAQQAYNDKLAVYQQTLKPTLAQQIALFRSHQDVARAQDEAKAAAERLTEAQKKNADAAGAGARNVDKLTIAHGQAEAAAHTFTGTLKSLGAQIEDTGGKFGQKYGAAISIASLATSALGAVIEAKGVSKLGKLVKAGADTEKAMTALRDVEVATSAEGAAAVEAGALKTEAALATEGAAAEAAAGKFTLLRAAKALGVFGVIVGGAVGVEQAGQYLSDHLIAPNQAKSIDELIANVTAKAQSAQNAANGVSASDLAAAASGTLGSNKDDIFNKQIAQSVGKALAQPKGSAKGDPFAEFLKSIGATAANGKTQAAVSEAAKAFADSVKTQFDAAKSTLTSVLEQSKQVRDTIGAALVNGSQITDVFGDSGPNLNGNHAFGKGQDFERVKRFFEARLRKLRTFSTELKTLLKDGLDPKIVAQIAEAGVDAGGRLADALSGASSTQLGQINSLNKSIEQYAGSTGSKVADAQFHKQIEAARNNAIYLGAKLDQANAHLAHLTGSKYTKDARAEAFLLGAG